MKNKIEFKKTIIFSLFILLLSSVIYIFVNIYQYKLYMKNTNIVIDNLISNILNKYDNISKNDIINILNNKCEFNNSLKEYGIDIYNDSLVIKNNELANKNIIINVIILIISSLSIILIYILYNYNKDKKLNEITYYLEELNKRNYKLNLEENSEDELSILKNEIYKITVLLKEESLNLKNDKISLKNNIDDISHQLKTPLTSILILLDNIIEDKNMDDMIRNKFIEDIKRKVLHINSLIYSLLKLSKFDTNSIIFDRKNVSINDIIESSINNVSILSDIKNITIDKEIDNVNIYCDFKWQVEAITNVIKNAIEYSKENSIVNISVSDNKLYTLIEIKNKGNIINSYDLKHIFDRFYKGKNSKNDSIGIGLNLAKTIIEKDNGIITVNSSDFETTFFIKYFKE